MSWFKARSLPEVKISGNRFEILEPEIVDAETQDSKLPVLRQKVPTVDPQTRTGVIPEHSWGA